MRSHSVTIASIAQRTIAAYTDEGSTRRATVFGVGAAVPEVWRMRPALGRFLPDFGRVVSQMQFNMYHHFTVDEHTIFAIGVLNAIERGRLKDEAPVASEVVHKVNARSVLYVAVLLHDIAKGRGGDHSELGAVDAEAFCLEHGMSQYEARLVAWLVRNHLALSTTAQKKDIGDPDVPQDPDDAGRDAYGVQAGLTLPLWFGKNKARLNIARAEMKKSQAAEQARINDTRTKIRNLFFRLENSGRLMKLYGEELLPQAARSMEIAETWFREGESTFSDFVETQAVWYNFQLALARARADYGKFLAQLERFVGQGLSQRTSNKAEGVGKEGQ